MFTRRVAPILLLVLFLIGQPAWAFLDPPYLTPASPTVGDTVYVNIYGGECDNVDDGIVWPPPVTQDGNKITIHFSGSHYEPNPEYCIFGVGTATFPVGSYPIGSYTLEVDWRYPGIGGVLYHETLGVIPFAVSGGVPPSASPAPTLGIAGMGILLLMLASAATWVTHRRRS